MPKNLRKFIFLLPIVFLLLTISSSASALEITYPDIPGSPAEGPQTRETTLVAYILYFFNFLIITAGIIGVISIAIAGLTLFTTAVGNPSAASAAKERIFGSIGGIILLMLSFIILKTINPELVGPAVTMPSQGSGVWFVDPKEVDPSNSGYMTVKSFSGKTTPHNNGDLSLFSSLFDDYQKYTHLFYKCAPNGANLLVWVYDKPWFSVGNTANITTHFIRCGDLKLIPIIGSARSFFWEYEQVGVYFYLTENCTDISSCADTGSSCAQNKPGRIGRFDAKRSLSGVRSMMIISGNNPLDRYGVILNKNSPANGECSESYINYNPGRVCFRVEEDFNGDEFDPYYADIIKFHPSQYENPDGKVTLKSSNLIYTLNQKDDIGEHFSYPDPLDGTAKYPESSPDNLLKNRGDLITDKEESVKEPSPPEYGCLYPTNNRKDKREDICINSIEPIMNYTTVFYVKNSYEVGGMTCGILRGERLDLRDPEKVGGLLNCTKEHNPDPNNPDPSKIKYLYDCDKYLYKIDIIP